MKTRNSTKSKLLSSVIALVLCVSMLIGATFAWFTDTASTGVNKIQAGNLDIQLLAEDGSSLEGKTLSWQKADGHTGESVLWEPGCTYKLQPIVIKNAGNLSLKYKITITGIQGSAKLNEAIDWTIVEKDANGNELSTALGADHTLAPGAFNTLTIQGTMRTDAGNEYQGLSIDGIGITVYATQMEAEFDSFNNSYDHDADYIERHATIMGDDGKTITLEQGKTYTVGNATVDVAANGDISYTNTGTAQTITIQTDGGNLTVNAPNDTIYHYGTADSVTINAIKGNSFHEFGEVAVLSIAQGRVVVENGDNIGVIQVKPSDAAATNPVVIAVPENVVLDTKIERTNATTAFKLDVLNSNGTAIEEKSEEVDSETIPAAPSGELEKVLGTETGGIATGIKNYVAINGKTYYDSLQDAVDAGGTVKLVNHVSLTDTLKVSKTVTIDMNGYNITGKGVRAIQVEQGTLNLDGVGTVSSTVENVGSSVIRVGDNAAKKSAYLYVYEGVTVSTGTAYGITAFGAKNEYVHVYGTVTSAARENAAYDGCAISTLGDDTSTAKIYIYDGATVSATNTNAIYMPSGTLYVYDGATVTGRTGIYVKSGSTTIEGGTITGNGPAVAYNYYSNGGISTGDALVVDSCGYPNGKPSVTVSGGTFTSANAKAVASYNTKGNALVTGFVRGGTFSSEPVEDYLFDGRFVATNTNGTFTVEVDEVAQIGEVYYGTLYEAVSACTAGETIKLLRDVTLDKAYVTYDGWANCATGTLKGTLDGNNHTITLGEGIFFGRYFGNKFMYNPCLKNVNIVANNGSVYAQAYRGTFENVKVSGSIEVGNNTGAFVIYGSPYYNGALTFKNCEMAATMYGGGTANNYNAAFVGYGMGSGAKFNFEDCKMTGSLTCGVAAVFLGNDSQLGGNWKVNISNFTFGENAAVRNTLTSGYSWKFNGIVAANNAPGTPVVTIDDTPYSGKGGFTQLIDAKNTIWDASHFAYGPLDASLKLTKNEDGTFTITPAEREGAVKYVVSMAVYTTATAGGSLVQSVKEEISAPSAESNTITTKLKDLKFIDKTWLTNNTSAEEGTLAGNTIYTLDGVSYYMIGDNVHGTLNGNPKSAQIYGVTAYDANGNIVASAPLTK